MTLDEAINHAEETADNLELEAECIRSWGKENDTKRGAINCEKRAKEYRQLAEWLRELKELMEQKRWIPVSERLPDGLLVKTLVSCEDADGLPFCTMVAVYDGSEWDCEEKVVAWMPLPEPYKAESEE